jgi:SAM-dependent methyltransferase
MNANPWLEIPIEDYEGHMSAVGQSAALRELFSRIYTEQRPRRLAVLGCTNGTDLQAVDVGVTETVVGVDINPRYLESARLRLGALGGRLHLVQGDVLEVERGAVFLALLFALVGFFLGPGNAAIPVSLAFTFVAGVASTVARVLRALSCYSPLSQSSRSL